MKYALTTILAIMFTAGTMTAGAFDQLPPGKWWENEKLQREISLSTQQQKQIHALVYEHAMGMIDLNAAVKKAELELANLVEQPDFDPAAVRRAFGRFQEARHELETSRFEMLLSVRQVLSAEQWGRLQELRREFERNRGQRRGPRPDGPPRGGPDGGRPPRLP